MSLSTLLSAAVKNPDGTYNIPKSVDRANKMLGTVLTVSAPIDGVWQMTLTIDGNVVAAPDGPFLASIACHAFPGHINTDWDSDAAAAGEHAVDLLADAFDIVVTSIVYPDGQTVVC